MPAGFHSLGDDGVHTRSRRALGVRYRADLIHHLHASRVRPRHVRARIAPEGHQDGHALLQTYIYNRVHRKGQVRPAEQHAHAEGLVR